jgi:peptidoglycan-N-acetylglucosamine deacetylase
MVAGVSHDVLLVPQQLAILVYCCEVAGKCQTEEDMGPGLILVSRQRCGIPSHECILTFDDGPSGIVTEEVLGVLSQAGVKACFCVVGSEVVAHSEQTRAMAKEGHVLVNHSFHHRFTDLWHPDRLRLDLALCDKAVADALGAVLEPLPWFRPPFGIVTRAVREIGRNRRILPVTHFAFDSWFNSVGTTLPCDWIISNAKRQLGGIYVVHDGLLTSPVTNLLRGRPDRGWVPSAVRRIIECLTACGFHFPEPAQALARLAYKQPD